MLYPTHYHPFPNPSLSPQFLQFSSHPLQAMESALKSAGFSDDFVVVSGGGGDDFFVDELLDFSNDFEEEEQQQQQLQEPEGKEQDENSTAKENSGLSLKDDFGSLPESELSVPAEGLESLEWLSHFVEDSFPDYSLTGKLPPKPAGKRSELAQEQPCFATQVQTKARTKRARTGVRVWPVLSPSFNESSTSSSSSSSSTTTSFSGWPVHSQTGESFLGKPAAMKSKKKPADHSSAVAAAQPRRCSHCGVTKTPQWRAGPLGSKTLCNACGVRFKSGRLLPEYRPACSPTFSTELHSNNHRKVLEMRRNKESETDAGLIKPAAVHSFEEL